MKKVLFVLVTVFLIGMSSFALEAEESLDEGLKRLAGDLKTGAWAREYGDLLDRDAAGRTCRRCRAGQRGTARPLWGNAVECGPGAEPIEPPGEPGVGWPSRSQWRPQRLRRNLAGASVAKTAVGSYS